MWLKRIKSLTSWCCHCPIDNLKTKSSVVLLLHIVLCLVWVTRPYFDQENRSARSFWGSILFQGRNKCAQITSTPWLYTGRLAALFQIGLCQVCQRQYNERIGPGFLPFRFTLLYQTKRKFSLIFSWPNSKLAEYKSREKKSDCIFRINQENKVNKVNKAFFLSFSRDPWRRFREEILKSGMLNGWLLRLFPSIALRIPTAHNFSLD